MPRIISDELYDQLTDCIKAGRLLGVMGMLERMEETAKHVTQVDDMPVQLDSGIGVYKIYVGKGEFLDGPKTNHN